MALRWPSSVWRTVDLISCSFFPRNCSEAVWSRSGFFIIFTYIHTTLGTKFDIQILQILLTMHQNCSEWNLRPTNAYEDSKPLISILFTPCTVYNNKKFFNVTQILIKLKIIDICDICEIVLSDFLLTLTFSTLHKVAWDILRRCDVFASCLVNC